MPPAAPPPRPAAGYCPECGQALVAERRFCPHCGHQTASAAPGAPTQAGALVADKSEYVRSLPPLYRWRWPLTAAVGIVALGAVVALNPVRIIGEAWASANATYAIIAPTDVAVSPLAEGVSVNPERLIDGSLSEFTMPWQPEGESTSCGPAKGTSTITLTIPPTRIRHIQIAPGLAEGNKARDSQPRPKTVGILFDGEPAGGCPFALTNTAGMQDIAVDSGRPVTKVTITIGSAYPAGSSPQALISITEVALFERK
ncbi:MAG: zinc ribbon domain-containing protein [Arachnia sp.]